jgi:hypothetical protein
MTFVIRNIRIGSACLTDGRSSDLWTSLGAKFGRGGVDQLAEVAPRVLVRSCFLQKDGPQ